MEEQDMTAEQAAAGARYYNRRHNHRDGGGCGSRRGQNRGQNQGRGGCGHRHGPHHSGPFKRTIAGISEKFGIPRKGVMIAWILTLIFSFPVGVFLFIAAWSYVHHPEWFGFFGRRARGSSGGAASSARGAAASTREATSENVEHPTFGVDYEEPWMDELRAKFDDLERRTGNMEGYVASGDYNLSSELERMRKADDGKKASEPDDAQNADPNPNPKP
jgi:phage shock protein PspC (stress-responsive transcriptional regulator)